MGVVSSAVNAVAQLGGAAMDMYQTNKSNEFAWEKQKKLAQNQIQWRVADAVKAGLHPLAALGVNPASGPSAQVSSAGEYLSRMGSGIGEALKGIETPEEKAANAVLLERGGLENDLLKAQINSEKARLIQMQNPGSGSGVDQSPITLDTPFGPFTFPNRNAGQIAENAGGEGANWFFGGANTADALVKNLTGDPSANIRREIEQIVGADIWTQARNDLAKAWARGTADLRDLYTKGGVRRVLGY